MDNSPTKYLMIENGGHMNGGLLQMNEEWDGIPPVWTVYFAVVDTDATVVRVTELGGKVNVPPFDTPVGRSFVVGDPQGAIFSVIQLSTATRCDQARLV